MILKIGGSVLTNKGGDGDEESLSDAFADTLDVVADGISVGDDILVHGAGSFGHPHAARHGLSEGGREGAYETHAAVSRFNSLVVEGLDSRGVDALPVHPMSCALRDADGDLRLGSSAEGLRDEGFVPVLHGDVVGHRSVGVSVVSGDEIAVEIADEGERVGMCTSEPGVLGSDGGVLERVSSVDQVARMGVADEDVTGGMRSKVERLLSLKSGGHVFGVQELRAWLDGDDVGTLVKENEG